MKRDNEGRSAVAAGRAEHFQQCAEFPTLRNSSLRPLAMPVLAVALTRRRAATGCPAVQATSPPGELPFWFSKRAVILACIIPMGNRYKRYRHLAAYMIPILHQSELTI
jgi:hypothetical protein